MKKIDLSVVVPEALFQRWECLPPSRNAEVQAALRECLERLCEAQAKETTAPSGERALPQVGHPGWGEALSRRWTDLEAQRYAQATSAGEAPPAKAK